METTSQLDDRKAEPKGRPQLMEEGRELCKSQKSAVEGVTNVPTQNPQKAGAGHWFPHRLRDDTRNLSSLDRMELVFWRIQCLSPWGQTSGCSRWLVWKETAEAPLPISHCSIALPVVPGMPGHRSLDLCFRQLQHGAHCAARQIPPSGNHHPREVFVSSSHTLHPLPAPASTATHRDPPLWSLSVQTALLRPGASRPVL